jgi:predicted ATPase
MITRIEIDGFKSLRDFAMDLEPFTVLVGPNSAGKSNVLEALMLLSRLASLRIYDAFIAGTGHGPGIDLFTKHDGKHGRSMRFGVEMLAGDPLAQKHSRQTRFRYELSLDRRKRNDGFSEYLSVSDERLFALNRAEDGWVLSRPDFGRYAKYGLEGLHTFLQRAAGEPVRSVVQFPPVAGQAETQVPYDYTALAWLRMVSRGTLLKSTSDSLGVVTGSSPSPSEAYYDHLVSQGAAFAIHDLASFRLSQLDAARLREPSDRMAEGGLSPDVSNLPTYLAALSPLTLGSIRADLVALVPGLSSFEIVPERESLRIDFIFSGGERLPARLVSDGTLRLLALLTALRAEPRPTLLAIEEPENGIYPGRLKSLLELVREDGSELPRGFEEHAEESSSLTVPPPLPMQILLTTHSPVVLAALRSESQCLRFLDLVQRGGQLVTRARKVAPSITPAQARELVSLREVDRLLNSLQAEVAEVSE